MAGPFHLPADVKAGDYIEIGMLGAYGSAMRTDFNGFGSDIVCEVADEPMVSLYREDVTEERHSNVVQLRR
jgi:ornithine decarboxylase